MKSTHNQNVAAPKTPKSNSLVNDELKRSKIQQPKINNIYNNMKIPWTLILPDEKMQA